MRGEPEAVGGTFLLHATQPVVLHGVLTNITSGPDSGWVLASLEPSGPNFSCDLSSGVVRTRMDLDVGLRFAATLLILASRTFSALAEDATAVIGEVTVETRPQPTTLSWTTSASHGLKVALVEDAVELRMRSSHAAALAFRILRTVGALAQ